MISSKYISKIISLIMLLAIAACIAAVVFSDKLKENVGTGGVKMEYEDKLFDTSQIISLNIIMSDEDWADMIENAINEEYYKCDVEINGTRFYNVGIRPKGNTSLSNIVNDPDTDRYSFKLEFAHFVDGQTCWGLDKLILNNNYADATSMKEAIAYDMFAYLGADASLYNYADISVNGEYWGCYLALEAVEESFLMRNYGVTNGELYKPDPMGMNNMGGDGKDGHAGMGERPNGERGGRPDFAQNGENIPDFGDMPEEFEQLDFGDIPEDMTFAEEERPERQNEEISEDNTEITSENTEFVEKQGFRPPDLENMPEGFTFPNVENGHGGFGGMGNGNGADLNYIDDDLDSYSSIWEASVKNSSKKDHKRVVKALKNISEGKDIEEYMDIDNLLKYMAVHSFLVNQDSLSGNMAHNYYLYESGGKLNIIPWDYNLSFGGMGGMGRGQNSSTSGASSTINDAIDTPFDGTNFFDPLLENDEYLAKYHEYYRQLVEEYVNSGAFDEVYGRIFSQISDSIKRDPTAFYTYDEFTAAHETLYDVVKLRAESVLGQLDGTIPSTDNGQKNTDNLIDASDIDLSVMGQMMGGGPDENGDQEGGMRPGGMAPQRATEEEKTTKTINWLPLMISGAAMLIGLLFAGTFKKRKYK